MKTFEITGTYRENQAEKKFTKEVSAGTEHFAMEKLMSLIGSEHGTKRRNIVINEMKEVKEAKK